jgi:hypothetical protein
MNSNDAIRGIVILGLAQGGIAGKLAGGLVGVLWPASGDDVWDSIKARVEALINQKIREYEYRNVTDSLQGLKAALDLYRLRLADSTPPFISEQYTSTKTAFVTALPHFQSEPSKLLLLPLFAQFANLYLSLLRDGALHGADWGWPAHQVEDEKTALSTAIQQYTEYASTVYQAGLPHFDNPSARKNWTALNQYMRQMTLDVLDHRHYWQFFGLNSGAITHPTRTIYSDPFSGDEFDGVGFPEPPLARLTELMVWGSVCLWGVRTAYGNQLTAPQSWRGDGQSSSRSVDAPINAVTEVRGTLAPYRVDPNQYFRTDRSACVALSIVTDEGQQLLYLGTQPSIGSDEYTLLSPDRTDFSVGYDSHILGSVFMMSGGWGPMVFGFRLKNSY